ncbi:hypothetical protein AURDEDRAFT_165996 [Auricularia subglabra TFB-10046 SS5]|nr:hypothetical protein AURDEDRAFT_165996 [Auricularia subglabra TFB-10046 SS5]
MSVPRRPRAFLSKLRLFLRRNREPGAAQGAEPRTRQVGFEVHAVVDDLDVRLEAGLATTAGALARIPTVLVSNQDAVALNGAESPVQGGGDDGPAAVREEERELEPARVDQLDQGAANGIGGNEHANGVGGDGHANAIGGEGEGAPTAPQDREPEQEDAGDEAPDQDAPNGAPLPILPTTVEVVVRAVCDMAQRKSDTDSSPCDRTKRGRTNAGAVASTSKAPVAGSSKKPDNGKGKAKAKATEDDSSVINLCTDDES